MHDLLGVSGRQPKFARDFLQGAGSVAAAVASYVAAVKDGTFPGPANSY
jgi:3-methyl-2-oxobutanoate hydroxymethyltransferase